MVAAPSTPLEWVDALHPRLMARRDRHKIYDDYYTGKHPLEYASPKFMATFGPTFEAFANNWCEVVANAPHERLQVTGFRFPNDEPGRADQVESVDVGDREAWRIWQENNMDAQSSMALLESLVNGRAFVSVWFNRDDPATPAYYSEHPDEMIVAYDTANRSRRLAALKVWRDEWTGDDFVNLLLPDWVYRFRRSTTPGSNLPVIGRMFSKSGAWELRDDSEVNPIRNPLGVVPVVELANRQRLVKDPMSEIHRTIALQNAVNKLTTDMLVASEFGAAPARWAVGYELPTHPVTGEAMEPDLTELWRRLLVNENPEGRFGQFTETQLRNFVDGIEMLVQHIASQTRTPAHYLLASEQMPSGETIKSAETGLTSKVRSMHVPFGEGAEEVARLGFAVLGDARAKVRTAETIWKDPETRTESEHVDAVQKKKALGVPWHQLMIDLGYSPQEITRMKQWRAEDAQLAALGLDPFEVFDTAPESEPVPDAGQPAG